MDRLLDDIEEKIPTRNSRRSDIKKDALEACRFVKIHTDVAVLVARYHQYSVEEMLSKVDKHLTLLYEDKDTNAEEIKEFESFKRIMKIIN